MKQYLIDINILSYLADDESPFHEKVRTRFKALRDDDVATISILGLYELHYSLSKASKSDVSPGILKTKKIVSATLPIVPLSEEGAMIFGELKTQYQEAFRLKRNALARDTVDLLLASSAIENGAVLVSHDKMFEKLKQVRPDFQCEDWAI